MKTSEKLEQAFHEFAPHINGHSIAMDLFFEALEEVKNRESKAESFPASGVSESVVNLTKLDSYTDEEIQKAAKLLNDENSIRWDLAEKRQMEGYEKSGLLNCNNCGEKLTGRMEMITGYCEECD